MTDISQLLSQPDCLGSWGSVVLLVGRAVMMLKVAVLIFHIEVVEA